MLRIRQIKLKNNNLNSLEKAIIKRCKITKEELFNYNILKYSIDCRLKPNLYHVYEVSVNLKDEEKVLNLKDKDIEIYEDVKYEIKEFGNEILDNKIVVVGFGPAGIFTSYLLTLYGYKVIVLERGSEVDKRVIKIDDFWKNDNLDLECNVLFGEGGAGTFSDGKLNTLVKDKNNRMSFVFDTLIKFGAPEDIKYSNKPHIGTDILRTVVKNIRNEIIKLGGEIRFDSKLTDIILSDNKVKEIIINNNETLPCSCLVLAIGHSARDTFSMLNEKKIIMEPKSFAVGIRIIHEQEMINECQYGKDYDKNLPNTSYKLTHTCNNGRGVYTFCMCPGGYVINASSEKDALCINGMSYRDRNSGYSNSAVIVTISPDDYGKNILDGVKFQRELERKAYLVGNGSIPVQILKNYRNNEISKDFISVKPKFLSKYCFANINDIFPKYINDSLKEGLENFDKKIKGFNKDDAVILGVESRTSSPVRIIRNEELESNYCGIYPCGEGAGYAGGITSAAMDGLKVAEAIIKKYKA